MLSIIANIYYNYLSTDKIIRISLDILPISIILMFYALVTGLYHGLVSSPPDYQMGETVRIMYVHVPAVYGAILCYFVLFVSSIFTFFKKSYLAYISSRAIAPIGFTLTSLGLFAGMVWGYPTWGTWWVWDARLTSFFVLWLFYLVYLVSNYIYDKKNSDANFIHLINIIGFINVPIIKFSVNWWATLHQAPTLIRSGGASINHGMFVALMWMLGFMTLFILSVFILRLNSWHFMKGKNK